MSDEAPADPALPAAAATRPVVVVGCGNPLRGDDGVGIHVLHAVAARASLYPQAEFVDFGTAGFGLLHVLAGRRKAVIVDCARMGLAPGSLRRFATDQVRSRQDPPALPSHEGDLLGLLEIARNAGLCPPTVVILGIEPASLEPGLDLSPPLAGRVPEYADAVERELRNGCGHA